MNTGRLDIAELKACRIVMKHMPSYPLETTIKPIGSLLYEKNQVYLILYGVKW
jgi:hypothetical protein